MHKYPPHPAAMLMPRPSEEEYAQLESDILANGLFDSIELFDGQVLDGVTRQEICLKHDIELSSHYINLDEYSLGPHRCPYRYVLAKHTRRSLSSSQRAMAAAKVLEKSKKVENSTFRLSRSSVASAMGVDKKQVTDATTVLEHGSEELVESVANKDVSVSQAAKLVKKVPDKREQSEIVRAGKEEVKRRISGGTSFDVEEIEGAEAEPGRKPKNGAPLVSTKDRKEAVALLDKLSRALQKIGMYEQFIASLSQIRERLAGK